MLIWINKIMAKLIIINKILKVKTKLLYNIKNKTIIYNNNKMFSKIINKFFLPLKKIRVKIRNKI